MLKEFRTLAPYLKRHRSKYLAGLACLVAVDAAQISVPQFVKHAVDSLSTGIFDRGVILASALSIVGVAVIVSSGRFLWRYFIHGSSRRIEAALRDALFSRLLLLPPSFFQRNKTGDLMARATNDMQAVRMATGMGLVSFVDGAFMSVAILVIMFAGNPRIALLTIAPLPVVTVLIIIFGRLVGQRFKRAQELYSRLSDIAQETLQGIRVVKSFVKEDHFAAKFAEANDRYSDSSMSLVKIFGFFFPFIAFLAGITNLILIGAGGMAVLENRMTPGDIVAMLAYLEMLIWPMLGAGFTVNMLQRGAASLKRINEILDEPPEAYAPAAHASGDGTASSSGPIARSPGPGIETKDLSYTYPGAAEPSLRGVSLAIPPGSTVGVLGRVGSGKSTLLRILARIAEPPEGTVFVDGCDALDMPLEALRSIFGFVPQDTFLFSDTVRANVLFGKPGAGQEAFAEAVRISALERDAAGFRDGWDTVVGEKGLTLSGGQKQRIAIARALVVDPEVLVLDDALSAVDVETEEAILEALLAKRKGRTNLIVSNRVSTLRNADFVVVFEDGSISESGTHDELVRRDGFYAEIARLQALSAGGIAAARAPGA
ncbi:MAG: ABC transporter ATP-binding protein [Spirochaetes bacterium]|nr:ABC transporter ATP-binding protein [Spirochaetota bacterium]